MNKFVEKYGQILLPLITPYDGEENVNYACYEELIDYVIKNDPVSYTHLRRVEPGRGRIYRDKRRGGMSHAVCHGML